MLQRLTLRRALFLIVAMVAGGLTVLIGAEPASAHYSSVYGKAECISDTGMWKITWTITNRATNHPGTLIKMVPTPADATIDNVAVGSVIPNPGSLVGTQMVPGTTTGTITLTIRATWPADGFTENQDRVSPPVQLRSACVQDQPKPNASFTSACDGSVTATLTNDADATRTAAFTVKGDKGFTKPVQVTKGGSVPVTIPGEAAGHIVVSVVGGPDITSAWAAPADCPAVTVASKSDCTSLAITLDNPAGNQVANAVVDDGTKTQDVAIPAGGTQALSFAGKAGLTVTVRFVANAAIKTTAAGGPAPLTVAWKQPAACATAPTLPTTGAHLGPLIAAGSGLLALGAAVLFALFRRRLAAESRTF